MEKLKLPAPLFYGTLAFVLCASLILPDRTFSENENRTLATFPEFSWQALTTGDFTSDVETYLADQFPLRDTFMSLKAFATQVLGQRENNGVYLAGDRLIEKVDSDNTQLQTNLTALNQLHALLSEQGITLSFAPVPTAGYVYAEDLPYGAPTANQAELLAQLSQFEGDYLDLSQTLLAHKDDYIFYRTDHHWTTEGAFYAAQEVLLHYQFDTAELPIGTLVASDFQGTLYSSSGYRHITPDEIWLYAQSDEVSVQTWRNGDVEDLGGFYDFTKFTEKDKYAGFLGGNTPLVTLNSDNDGEKLLIIRDSYADVFAPYLTGAYSEVHLFDARYYRTSILDYVTEHEIDQVLVLYSLKNFATDVNLPMVCR